MLGHAFEAEGCGEAAIDGAALQPILRRRDRAGLPSAAMLAINAVKSIIVLRLFSNLPGKYIRQRRRTPNDGSYDSVSCPGSVSSIARRFALTHRGLNLSVGLTEIELSTGV